MYLSYEEYKKMGGTLDETAYNSYLETAEKEVDYYTFGRISNTNITQNIKKCIYELIKICENKAKYGIGAVTSTGNDGVSQSYNIPSVSEVNKLYKEDIKSTIQRFLSDEKDNSGTPLLYRGLI